jgi:putative ABC transport system permease protein
MVQKDTLGPYAESSSMRDDVYRTIARVARCAERRGNVTYLTMQVNRVNEATTCA